MANEASAMKTAYHVVDGPKQMYEIDANNAVGHHPTEWSWDPWSIDETNAYRQAQYEREVAEAEAAGRPKPVAPAPLALTDKQAAQVDADTAARAEATAIVAEADAKDKEKRDWEAKVAAARALLATPVIPPQPAPPVKAPGKAAVSTAHNPDAVEIDDDWEDLSDPKKRALAMKLGAPNTVTVKEAEAQIAAEVKRRATPVIPPTPTPTD